jgi:hypothetical protein
LLEYGNIFKEKEKYLNVKEMVSKRGLFSVFFVVVLVLLLSVFFVIAQDESDLAPFDAELVLGNSAPHIESWTEPDFDTTTSTVINAWTPSACALTTVTTNTGNDERGVDVTVSDLNGETDLDTTATVSLTITKAGQPTRAGTCLLDATSIGDASPLEAIFECTFDMQYYDVEGVADPGDAGWIITVSADDDTGAIADNDGQASQGIAALPDPNYPFFSYGTLPDVDLTDSDDPTLPLNTLRWTGLDVSSSNEVADNNMVIQNCGNVVLDAVTSFIQIVGEDMGSNTALPNTDLIRPDSFDIDFDATACVGGQTLADGTPINVAGISLVIGTDASPTVTDDAFFCLTDINNPEELPDHPITVTVDSYIAVSPWQLNACETGC